MQYLDISAISKKYKSQNGTEITVLDNFSFSSKKGETTAILGTTGCGKTTLLRIIASLEKTDSGNILLGGKPINQKSAALVFQHYSLFPWMTLFENTILPLKTTKTPRKIALNMTNKILAMVGLSEFKNHFPYEVSGGMQQRCALVRALLTKRPLLLLDEPFGALDERTRHKLQQELLNLQKSGDITTIIVTHSIDEAIFLANRIIIMGDNTGNIIGNITVPLLHPRIRTDAQFSKLYVEIRTIIEKHYEAK